MMKTTFTRVYGPLALFLAVLSSPSVRGATSYYWNVASPGANNWNVNANWLPATGNPTTGDTAVFGSTGTVPDSLTVNNVVSVNTTLATIQFTNQANVNWHVGQIPSGVTLTVTTSLLVGNLTTATGPTVAAYYGGGTLLVTGNTLQVGQGNTPAAVNGNTLDLSGLTNFVYSANAGTINVGSGNRSSGNLTFAAGSNSVTAATVNLNSASSSSSTSGTVNFGGGTNRINANTITIAAGNTRSSSTIKFLGDTGGLRIRGLAGGDADRATMSIGNRQASGSGGGNTGTLNLLGHPADIKLNTLTVGQSGNVTANVGTGIVSFDNGTIDATNILMGIVNIAGSTANGTLNVATNATLGTRGTLIVGAGGISMLNQTLGTANGTINITGGVLNSAGNIFKTTAGGTANFTVSDGGVVVLNNGGGSVVLGDTANPIDNLNLSDSRLTLPLSGATPTVNCITLTPGGTDNSITIGSLPGIGAFPAQFALIKYTSLNGGYNFVLNGTLPSGYLGYLSNNVANLSVDLVVTNGLSKSDVWRGNVNGNWDTSTLNWNSAGSPTNYQQGDTVTFDDTLTGTPNVNVTTTMLPVAVGFNNSTTNYVLSGTGKISGNAGVIKQGTASVRLAESGGDDFTGGVVVNDGVLILNNAGSTVGGGVTINAGTLQIGNGDTAGNLPAGALSINGTLVFNRSDNLTVATPINGSGNLVKLGAGNLTLTAANTLSGATTIQNGTVTLSSAGTLAASASVAVSNATLDVSALAAPVGMTDVRLTNSVVRVAVGASGMPSLSVTNLTLGGAMNTIDITALPPIGSYPVTFTIIKAGSPIAGTFNAMVGGLPAATPAYAANVTQSGDQTAVLMTFTAGPVGTRASVLWTGADVPNGNTNWTDRLNWHLPGQPQPGEAVFFTSVGTAAGSALSTPGGGTSVFTMDNVNNIVDADFALGSLTYTNLSDAYHNTFINNGRTLSITNNVGLTVGGVDSGATAQHDWVSVSGSGGTLVVNNTNASVNVWVGSGSVGGSQSILDMSALKSFTANISRFLVGSVINNTVNRPSGIVYLAKTNAITARFQTTTSEAGTTTANAALVVADCNGNAGSQSFLYLGQVNTISADIVAIARQKATAHFLFNPIYANTAPYPTLTMQGVTSSRMAIWDVGDGVGNTGTTSLTGDANLNGGTINVQVDTLNVGRASGGATGGGNTTGILQFDAGLIDALSVNLGWQPVTGSKVGIGTINVASNTVIGAGATLKVQGNLNLGVAVGGGGVTTTSGTLNSTNGIIQVGSIVAGSGSLSAINLVGGRFTAMGPVGTVTEPVGTLTLAPLATPDNSTNVLRLAAGANPAVSVVNLNFDALDTTTNLIEVGSIGPIGATPVELALIRYQTMSMLSGATFNIGLGTLPPGYTGYLTNDTITSTIGLVVTSAINPMPAISGVATVGNNIVYSGTNGFPNARYFVVSSTNLADPVTTWPAISTNYFAPNGSFSFTNAIDPTRPARFFSIQVP